MRSLNGFTLIEVVLVIVIVAILASVMIPVILEAVEALHYDQMRNNVVSSSRLSFDRLSSELRRIANARAVRFATSENIQFRNTISETLMVSRTMGPEAGELVFSRESRFSALATLVDEFKLRYFDEDGNEIQFQAPGSGGDLKEIRTIRMRATFSPRDPTRYDQPYMLQSEVRPLNYYHEEMLLP